MRTVLLANNRLGVDVGQYLLERGELEGVVLHYRPRRNCVSGREVGGTGVREWPDGFEEVCALNPDLLPQPSIAAGQRMVAGHSPTKIDAKRWLVSRAGGRS